MEFGRCVCVKVKLRIVAVPGLRAKVLALIKGGGMIEPSIPIGSRSEVYSRDDDVFIYFPFRFPSLVTDRWGGGERGFARQPH